jgi:fermentation-respiration switch protein FrsA (DUF1100 family)
VILSGAAAFFPGSWFDDPPVPLLFVHGSADGTNPLASSGSMFARASGPKDLLVVPGGSHLGPFTTDPARVAVTATVVDFLAAWLGGDATAAGRMADDAADGGLSLTEG